MSFDSRRLKEKVIVYYFVSYSKFFLALIYFKIKTSERHDSWKNIVYISRKKCRSLGHESIHNIRAMPS